MKLIALLAAWLFAPLISPIAYGQGFRGVSPRGFAGSIGNGAAGSQPRQGTVANPGPVAPARNFSTAPSAQLQSQPQTSTPRVFTPHTSASGVLTQRWPRTVIVTPGQFVSGRPGFIIGSMPQHPHRPAFFWHNPGIVILDARYFPATTVIIQLAPGVISEERRPPENPPDDSRTRAPGQLAPFDPTPQEVVERILLLAAIKPGEVLYDLGSGDGRIAITAAKKYGIRAVGFEIDPGLVKLARENSRKQGVEKLVEFRRQDFLSANFSAASVVTLYLSYHGNLALRPQLLRQLKPGARVVSYRFDMGEWQPKIAEAYRDGGGDQHMIYLWQIGEPLAFR
jgi:precorrin-6B methylase 2